MTYTCARQKQKKNQQISKEEIIKSSHNNKHCNLPQTRANAHCLLELLFILFFLHFSTLFYHCMLYVVFCLFRFAAVFNAIYFFILIYNTVVINDLTLVTSFGTAEYAINTTYTNSCSNNERFLNRKTDEGPNFNVFIFSFIFFVFFWRCCCFFCHSFNFGFFYYYFTLFVYIRWVPPGSTVHYKFIFIFFHLILTILCLS